MRIREWLRTHEGWVIILLGLIAAGVWGVDALISDVIRHIWQERPPER